MKKRKKQIKNVKKNPKNKQKYKNPKKFQQFSKNENPNKTDRVRDITCWQSSAVYNCVCIFCVFVFVFVYLSLVDKF